MMIIMNAGASDEQIAHVLERLHAHGAETHLSKGQFKAVIGIVGDKERIIGLPLEAMPGVESVIQILKPYKLASKQFKSEKTVVTVGTSQIGGEKASVIAGPCAIESSDQVMQAARAAKAAGAAFMRGGAYKPRSSPYSFQGLGEEGLQILADSRTETGLPFVTEVLDVRDVETVAKYADVLQVGTRNMANFQLLTELGYTKKPVLLKRGMGATIEELLMAAEYILRTGNSQVILCERGIRTFEDYTRNTVDISAIPAVHSLSHLPIIVDPSHGAGKRELVAPLAKAAMAAGADGVMIEIHPCPEEALCDGPQSLTLEEFSQLMIELSALGDAIGRPI